MKILFITSNRLGDAVLSTGLLHHLRGNHPDAKITIVCGAVPAPLFEAVPNAEVFVLTKKPYDRHWLEFLNHCIWHKWDIVVDLRKAFVSRFLMTRKRYERKNDNTLHKVEENALVLGLKTAPPYLWLTEEGREKAKALIPDGGPVLAIGPTANWIGKTWAAENFAELVRRLTAKGAPFEEAKIAVFGADSERAQAEPLLKSIPRERRIDLIGKGNPLEIAACLERCVFYVGNDSGLMHMAAALSVPTLGLFGPSRAEHYRPWGAHADFVRTDLNYDALVGTPGYNHRTTESLMASLSVDKVERAAIKLYDRVK